MGLRRIKISKSSRLFIVDDNFKLLLFRYHDEHQAPFWVTVGGELIDNENYLSAAQRELVEDTGLKLEIGDVLRKRDEVYAVAGSKPARWLEKYLGVHSPVKPELNPEGWTDEEKTTIKNGNGGV